MQTVFVADNSAFCDSEWEIFGTFPDRLKKELPNVEGYNHDPVRLAI